MVTAIDDSVSVEESFRAGASEYIPKPVHWAVLQHRIKTLLELRRAKGEIEAQEARMAAVAERALDGIMTVDEMGLVETVNPVLERLIGRPFAEIAGHRVGDFFREFPRLDEKEEGLATHETVIVGREGSQTPVEIHVTGFIFDCRQLYAAIIRDITLRKGIERELEAANEARIRALEELRQKEQLLIQQSRMAAMGEMLGNIAHQWRQPLNVLALQVQELRISEQHGDLSREALHESVEKSMEIIKHLSRTIDDFREFLVLDKKKVLFNLDLVIRKAVSLVEGSLKMHDITVEVISTDDPQINGRPNEFGQVLINILMNAKDAFVEQEKGGARKITIRSWTEQGRTVVTITDNAGGIREEILDKIFDAYFTTKPLGQGTGVGLFMSNAIIEKSMGGRLSVRNVEGGAEFRIEI